MSRVRERMLDRWTGNDFVQRRLLVQVSIDSCAWALALAFGLLLRYEFAPPAESWPHLAIVIVVAGIAQTVAGLASGLYLGRWRFGSFDEVLGLVRSVMGATAVLFVIDLLAGSPRLVPLSVVLAAGTATIVITGAARYAWRLSLDGRRRPGSQGSPIIVFGAGESGAQVITSMLRDPASPYIPAALLDDDPQKRNLEILGVHVLGGRSALATAVAETGAEILLLAMPSAGSDVVRDLTEQGQQLDLRVKVLPPVSELYGEGISVRDIRDVTPADLLGRHEITTDVQSIADYVTGKRVLVTGAGGSIGSELCRQLFQFAPAELQMLDRDESALHAVELSITGRAMLDNDNLILCDIRDRSHVDEIFATHRPEVVFHAAALKHLTMLERFPGEAVQSNVWGTLVVLEAAERYGVDRFVNISTDKAADASSVLGYTKRIAERLTASVARDAKGTYLSVRFGNVLGSRGSVLGAFQAQIDAGGPVTVTHPDVTRYFMTVQEAVELVIQAGAIGRDGEALVLDVGRPVRIADVAAQMAAAADRPIRIVYTGLRKGEKLHEVLLSEDELDVRPSHPLIAQVRVPPLEREAVADLDPRATTDELVDQLRDLAGATVGDRRD